MPRITNPIEATGEQVAANIKRLRGSMQYKELSERLSAAGRPMTPVAIRDAENGKRRVDVDDLMAFAIVFGVSPLTLLLPESGSRDVIARITGRSDELRCNQIWNWGTSVHPLPSESAESVSDMKRRRASFRERSKPNVDKPRLSDEQHLVYTSDDAASIGLAMDKQDIVRMLERMSTPRGDGMVSFPKGDKELTEAMTKAIMETLTPDRFVDLNDDEA